MACSESGAIRRFRVIASLSRQARGESPAEPGTAGAGLGLPKDNPKGYDDSIVSAAGNLRGSLLLVHGTSDDNVHFQNTIQMTDVLIKAGKQFRLMVYPDKTHGISGAGTRTQLFHMMEDFWNRELR
jgi:dipeptidyl-peptidase-4